jgi:nitroreductase
MIMDVLEAIYKRRSIRKYQDRPVPRETICMLIRAAVQAPSALNLQPWSFLVVDDRRRLKAYSDRAKAHILETLDPKAPAGQLRDFLSDPGYNIFYSAPALIVVSTNSTSEWVTEDGCLAAENLMLAAVGMGLGTCVIGFRR